jgi:hypothetical protein
MPVGEQRHVAIGCAGAGDNPVHPCTYLLRRFAARTSILENQPAWRLLMDLLGRQPFILAVVPLGKIGIDDGGVVETLPTRRSPVLAASD